MNRKLVHVGQTHSNARVVLFEMTMSCFYNYPALTLLGERKTCPYNVIMCITHYCMFTEQAAYKYVMNVMAYTKRQTRKSSV